MGKKLLYIIPGIVCLVLIWLILRYFGFNIDFKRDAIKFKYSYELYNGQKMDSGEEYKSISIDKHNKIEYLELDEVISKLQVGTSLIYLASPIDNINRLYVENIIKTTKESKLKVLYYFEVSNESTEYKKILTAISDETFTLPSLIAIKKGKIIGRYDITSDDISDEEFVNKINELINSVLKEDTVCDETC